MKDIIIYDLFGGGQNSVYESLKDTPNLKVYTFDVTEPSHKLQFKCDLSNLMNFINCKNDNNIPDPDIIIASPLCQSFSPILQMKSGGCGYWEIDQKYNTFRMLTEQEFNNKKSGFTAKFDAKKQRFIAELGIDCLLTTLSIIERYQPKYFYIENPRNSFMWKIIKIQLGADYLKTYPLFYNKCSYGKYGFLTNKPTIFLSNLEMSLKYGSTPKPYKETDDGKYIIIDNEKIKKSMSRSGSIAQLNLIKKKRNFKTGIGGLDFLKPTKKSKPFSTEQIGEAGPASAIPHDLIREIFSYFLKEMEATEYEKIV